jgi:hypothetical protein
MVPPKQIDPYVLDFCNSIVCNAAPLYVPLQIEPDAIDNNCFINVPTHISKHGGHQIVGWSIWEWTSLWIEAEFHAIWKSQDGQLIDITPKEINPERILFLPDLHAIYEGKQVNNIRKSLRHNALINDLHHICDKIFREMNRGELAYQHGIVRVSASVLELEVKKQSILIKIHRKFGAEPGRTH